MHPGLAKLMLYHEGDMPAHERQELDQHLKTCWQCQMELENLAFAGAEHELNAPPMDATLAGIRQWADRRQQEDPGARAVKARVEAEIGRYLGPGGAGSVLHAVSGGKDLLPAIEPVLAVFLGYRAASRLIYHVVDRAIVRI